VHDHHVRQGEAEKVVVADEELLEDAGEVPAF